MHFVKHKWHLSLKETVVGEKKKHWWATEQIRDRRAGRKTAQRWCCTVLDVILYHALGDGGLSLAQRESMEVLAHARGLGQLQQGPCGVHPRRQNKDQRSPAGGFLHNLRRGQNGWEWMSQHAVTHLTPNNNPVMRVRENFRVSYNLTELDNWCMKHLFNLKLIQIST